MSFAVFLSEVEGQARKKNPEQLSSGFFSIYI